MGGAGVYEDVDCTEEGAGGYSWLRPTSTPFTSTAVHQNGEENGYALIKWTSASIVYEIHCNGASGEGTLANTASQAKIEGYELTLSNCTMEYGCEVSSDPESSGDEKMIFNPLKASSPTESSQKLEPELKFEPEQGEELVAFSIGGCPVSGNYFLSGSIPALFDNEEGYIGMNYQDVKDSESMKLNGTIAAGMTGQHRVLSEGEDTVKLDIVP
jgi:hypothetical protein